MMNSTDRIRHVTDHFSPESDIWRTLDFVISADRFLNLGYSPWYGSHLLGYPQRRLVDYVADRLDQADRGWDWPLLDVGCGRGGPAARLSERYGYSVIGIDLVPANIRFAASHTERAHSPSFAVADATSLPLATDSVGACVSLDAVTYSIDRLTLFSELRRVVRNAGPIVITDLCVDSMAPRRQIDRFVERWGMSTMVTHDEYCGLLTEAGLPVTETIDLTPNSVGRFRTWTRLFLELWDTFLGNPIEHVLQFRDIDPESVLAAVEAAHGALPHLEHHLFVVSSR